MAGQFGPVSRMMCWVTQQKCDSRSHQSWVMPNSTLNSRPLRTMPGLLFLVLCSFLNLQDTCLAHWEHHPGSLRLMIPLSTSSSILCILDHNQEESYGLL